jgi:UDP-3-O-[3-hydroxymyristoyl] glucosamine N-acyltransferase
VVGDGGRLLRGFAGVDDACPDDVTFATNARWVARARRSSAGAVLVREGLEWSDDAALVQIIVADPNAAFAIVVERFTPTPTPEPGVHPDATVDPAASVDPSARIGPRAVLGAGASIGPRTSIGAGAFVGESVRVGADCRIHPNVTLLDGVQIGDRVIIWPGTVIGADGFGYATTCDGIHAKLPQSGVVVVEDDVEIGACVCIDRARLAETRIGRGTKIDNLVQIAHNVRVGPHCLIVSQVGIAGSTELGHHVVLGGHTGVTGHVMIGDGAQVAAFSGVSRNLPGGQAYLGVPALPLREGKRVRLFQNKLPELYQRIKALEQRLEELEGPRDALSSSGEGSL